VGRKNAIDLDSPPPPKRAGAKSDTQRPRTRFQDSLHGPRSSVQAPATSLLASPVASLSLALGAVTRWSTGPSAVAGMERLLYTLGAEVSTLWRVARRRRSGALTTDTWTTHAPDRPAGRAVLKLKHGAVRERLVRQRPSKGDARAREGRSAHCRRVHLQKC